MKKQFLLLLLILPIIAIAQHPSTNVIPAEKYKLPTQWSCIDKHFGYYFTNYSVSIPTDNNKIEKGFVSYNFKAGYTYRYKIVDKFDIGTELSYSNKSSYIKKDNISIFKYDDIFINDKSKIKTFHNSVEVALFFRFNTGGATYRKLGNFIDIGGFFDYAFNYGLLYKTENKEQKQKTRIKNPDYLDPMNYGAFVRLSTNYIALICSYDFGDWIKKYSSTSLSFSRTPLTIGIQFNLFAR